MGKESELDNRQILHFRPGGLGMKFGVFSAFFINLDRDRNRRAVMECEFERVGITAERLSAVEGRAVPNFLRRYYGEKLSDGEVGCSASHLSLCKLLLERGLPFALVFEDDARLAPRSAQIIQMAINKAPANWDVIRLVESSSQPFQVVADLGSGRSLVRYLRVPRSTTGLAVSASGAKKLLTPRTIVEPIDVEIRWPWQLDLNVYGIEPPIVTQASGLSLESTIPLRSRPKKLNQLSRFAFNIRKMGLVEYLYCRFGKRAQSKVVMMSS
jgi:glycosyl transferase, family 25